MALVGYWLLSRPALVRESDRSHQPGGLNLMPTQGHEAQLFFSTGVERIERLRGGLASGSMAARALPLAWPQAHVHRGGAANRSTWARWRRPAIRAPASVAGLATTAAGMPARRATWTPAAAGQGRSDGVREHDVAPGLPPRSRARWSCRWRAIAPASASPSKVEVPRPISSISTSECSVAAVHDGGGLGHLQHEGGLGVGQVVGRADAGVDGVDGPQAADCAGTKEPMAASSTIRATWRMKVALAAHVRAGDDQHACGCRAGSRWA